MGALTRILLVLSVSMAIGCESPPQTSGITSDDLDEVTAQMSAKLASSDFLRDRNPSSPPILITINKVENLTSDLIPPAEQWMLMARLQGSLNLVSVRNQKNISFQVPPEYGPLIRDAGYNEPLPHSPMFTHTMTATYRSATRTKREDGFVVGRVDLYQMQYRIFDVTTRALVWNDEFAYKREALGRAQD